MSQPEIETITINNVEYVRKDSLNSYAEKLDGMEYVLIRTYSAGVHAGYLKSKNNDEVELINARRIWKWSGAATLSQLAQSGTSDPNNCKFPEQVNKIILTNVIEIISVTAIAKKSIDSVKIWKA